MVLPLKIWLQQFVKNGHFLTKIDNSMTQRFLARTIKPWEWLALTMSYNISESQKGEM